MGSIDVQTHLNIFIISGFISIITLLYITVAYVTNICKSAIPFALFPIFIPLLYGIFGIINYYIIKKFGIRYSFIIGMVFGLLLSIIGRFGLNLPILLFNFTKQTEHKVHIYAILLYAIIFRFIITPITIYIVGQ